MHAIAGRTHRGGCNGFDKPEWRIIDEETWIAAQLAGRKRKVEVKPRGKTYRSALSGIARCKACGGAIGASRTKRSGGIRVPAYACPWHHERGSSVCRVTLHQEVSEA